jgi:phosphate transport system protein
VPQELRVRFHQDLDEIDTQVRRLFGLVCERVSVATDSLVTGDTQAARGVTGSDVQVDRLEGDLEQAVERLLLMESPMASEMRYLVTVLRIVPQLERCGDLAEHVAHRTLAGLGTRLSPRIRGLLTEMGTRCVTMWQDAAEAWSARADVSPRLDEIDDEIDDLHEELCAEIQGAGMDVADVMQATLVGRFYERLGDHAVHLSQRVAYIATPHAPPATT